MFKIRDKLENKMKFDTRVVRAEIEPDPTT